VSAWAAGWVTPWTSAAWEFGCVTPFSHDGGNWAIEDGRMRLMTDVAAAAYTGGHAVADRHSNGASGQVLGCGPR